MQIIDETLIRMEDLQKRLNEVSLYLTPFDCEQATLELKVSYSHVFFHLHLKLLSVALGAQLARSFNLD